MQQIQLIHGDCLEGMQHLPDGIADYCFTDPPYGIAYKPGHRKKNLLGRIVNDNLKPRQFQELMDAAFAQIRRLLKDDAVIHVCGGWSTADLVLPVLKAHFRLKACIIWDKVHLGLGWWTRSRHEFVYLATKGDPRPPRPATADIWPIPRPPTNRRLHVCEKPVDLVVRAMAPHTRPGDLVIDPFMGSAPVAEACHRTGRQFVGWEVEEANYRQAVARMRRVGDCIGETPVPFVEAGDAFIKNEDMNG